MFNFFNHLIDIHHFLQTKTIATMEKTGVPHVIFLPFPAQGHIKPMLNLAEILSHAGFQATFVNTEHNHHRIIHNTDIHDRFPKFQFKSIPDGFPSDHLRSDLLYIRDFFRSCRVAFKPALRELLISLKEEKGPCQPPTCMIADGIMCFAIDVAEEFEISTIFFRTFSAHCLWTYFHLSKLIEEGEVPFQGQLLLRLFFREVSAKIEPPLIEVWINILYGI